MVALKGGDKLTAKLKELSAQVAKAATLRVGFLEGSTDGALVSLPLVAAIQEFGAPSRNIPPRPFFRNMIAAKSSEWPEAVADLLVANNFDAEKALSLTGESIKGQLQQSIEIFVGAPLSPATIQKKGFDKQLVDTGHMRNSVGYEVK